MDAGLGGWLGTIVIGGIAGWVASMVMKTDASMGVVANVVVGVVGALHELPAACLWHRRYNG